MAPGHTRDSSKASSGSTFQFSEVSWNSTQASEAPSETESGHAQDSDISPKTSISVPQRSAFSSDTESGSAENSESIRVTSGNAQDSDISPKTSVSDRTKQKHVHGPQCRHPSPFEDFPTWDCFHADTSRHPSKPPKRSPEADFHQKVSFDPSDTPVSDDRTDQSVVGPATDIEPTPRSTRLVYVYDDDSDPSTFDEDISGSR